MGMRPRAAGGRAGLVSIFREHPAGEDRGLAGGKSLRRRRAGRWTARRGVMSFSKALDRVRRGIDEAMIFASLMVLAWPLVFERMAASDAGVLDWLLPAGVVVAL